MWFLTPTVQLCRQQAAAIKIGIPYATIRCIVGEDAPHLWGSAEVWRQALNDVDVIVSTYAVLYEALAHDFVNIRHIGLLVFDEGMISPHQVFNPLSS